ncbi:MAG: hypothetical protein GX100_05595 [candidate division WS1 bacterium]|nr:hypothetical protein [candidate division WS1 bacterium]
MDLRSCRTSTINALKWLLSQQNADGSFRPAEHGLATLAKLLWALGDMGQQPKAAQLSTWLRASSLDEDGDLSGAARPAPWDHFYPVANAFLAVGAMRLSQFALAYPLLEWLTSLQHPETGGFLTAGPEAPLDGEQDLLTTAVCAYACLQCGQLREAEAAGGFLLRLWENQPGGAAARLYMVTHNGEEILSEFPAEAAPWYAIDTGQREQFYHAPALAAGFLACLADASGSQDYLEGTHRYLQFLDSCADDRHSSEHSAFIAWAAALAYEITGSANYQRTVEAVVDSLLATQLNNGSWLKGSMGADLTSDVVDATAENIIVLNQVLRSLVGTEE